jgi:hypothetical protein
MGIRPSVAAASPVQCQESEQRAHNEEQRADWITCPDDVENSHFVPSTAFGGPVEQEESEGGQRMEDGLYPKDPSPTAGTNVGNGPSSESANPVCHLVRKMTSIEAIISMNSHAANGPAHSSEALRKGPILQG